MLLLVGKKEISLASVVIYHLWFVVKNIVDFALLFHNTFIFSCGLFQYEILLFYFIFSSRGILVILDVQGYIGNFESVRGIWVILGI